MVVAATVCVAQDPEDIRLSFEILHRVSIATAMAMGDDDHLQRACNNTVHMHHVLVYPSFLFILLGDKLDALLGLGL